MPERFNQRVGVQTGDLSTGRAQTLLTLSDRLDAFSDIAAKKATEQAVEKATTEAKSVQLTKKDGVTQRPGFKDVGFFGSIQAKVFNETLMSTYIAGVNSDIKTGIAKIKYENSTDVLAFNDKAEGFKAGVLKGVDPTIRQQAELSLNEHIEYGRMSVQKAQDEKQMRQMKGKLKSALDNTTLLATTAMFEGNREEANTNLAEGKLIVDQMVAAGFISIDEGREYIRQANRESTEQWNRRTIDKLSDRSIDLANQTIDEWSKEMPDGWEPDEWKVFLKSARQDVKYKKSIKDNEADVISDATENEWINKAAKGQYTSTDFASEVNKINDPEKRKFWLGYLQSQTKAGKAAEKDRQAELERKILKDRRDQRWRWAESDRKEKEAKTKQEMSEAKAYKDLNELFDADKLTKDMINNSNASKADKKYYTKRYEDRVKVQTEISKANTKRLAEIEIQTMLGEWTDADINSFVDRVGDPGRIEYWKEQNRQIKSDPNNFRNSIVFKEGLKDLGFAKKNYLFSGGDSDVGLTKDNENSQLYMQAIEEYIIRSSEPGADFTKILDEIKKPFIEEAEKNWVDRILEKVTTFDDRMTGTAPKAPQAAIDFLIQNPDQKENFRKKYGYVPEGI